MAEIRLRKLNIAAGCTRCQDQEDFVMGSPLWSQFCCMLSEHKIRADLVTYSFLPREFSWLWYQKSMVHAFLWCASDAENRRASSVSRWLCPATGANKPFTNA